MKLPLEGARHIAARAIQFAAFRSPVLAQCVPGLDELGWIRSCVEHESVDRGGAPLPWITYPAIAFLQRRVRPEMEVFEYGSGSSTRWWASRVRSVVAVEHDEAWAHRIRPTLPDNATVLHVPLDAEGRYARAAAERGRPFDVVVVDGRDRVRCVTSALGALKPEGVILFDNTDRPQYEAAYDALRAAAFRRLEFVGLAPMIGFNSETSVFYRTHNCLGI